MQPRAPEEPELSAPPPRPALFTHDLLFVPIPKRLRYYEGRTFHLGLILYLTLGFSSTFSTSHAAPRGRLLSRIVSGRQPVLVPANTQ